MSLFAIRGARSAAPEQTSVGDLDAPIVVESMPPERRRASSHVAACCGCSCCCCCCLHTVGSLAGAGIGSVVFRKQTAAAPAAPETDAPVGGWSAATVFWVATLAICLLIPGPMLTLDGGLRVPTEEQAFEALLILLLAFPLVQILALFLSGIGVALSPKSLFPEKGKSILRLAYILGFTVLGAGIGTGIMVLVGVVISLFN